MEGGYSYRKEFLPHGLCHFYLRHGYCKNRANCKWDHPSLGMLCSVSFIILIIIRHTVCCHVHVAGGREDVCWCTAHLFANLIPFHRWSSWFDWISPFEEVSVPLHSIPPLICWAVLSPHTPITTAAVDWFQFTETLQSFYTQSGATPNGSNGCWLCTFYHFIALCCCMGSDALNPCFELKLNQSFESVICIEIETMNEMNKMNGILEGGFVAEWMTMAFCYFVAICFDGVIISHRVTLYEILRIWLRDLMPFCFVGDPSSMTQCHRLFLCMKMLMDFEMADVEWPRLLRIAMWCGGTYSFV